MIRLAFIGAGQMAHHHVLALSKTGCPVTVVGIHDRIAERADELAALAHSRRFESLEDLLASTNPDIVHVCTPPETHFDAAHAALSAGAHVYVEKPFARTSGEARELLAIADHRRLIVCAGHQLLRDPAFERLIAASPRLGTLTQVDSHFTFHPAKFVVGRSGAALLARALIDILPHPLYALVAALERWGTPRAPIALEWARADATDVQAILRAGDLVGRLSVSLRARPIASSLTLIGTEGSLSCDFVRSIVIGAGNPGTEALEKVVNPVIEGVQLISRTTRSVANRLQAGASYPGLAQSIGAFHRAVATGGVSPLSPAHLLRVTEVFEKLVSRIDAAAHRGRSATVRATADPEHRLTVVTGARGFLGAEISRKLPHVRGIGRGGWADGVNVDEWVPTDLSNGLRPDALAGADVVVHAAAETAGGYAEHRRNTVEATNHLLRAMHDAGVRRLLLVSSLSVIRPPRTGWERQDELTARPADPTSLGPYTWGKARQEALAMEEAARLGIAVKIVRPGALLDRRNPSLPGLMGRRLVGRWHLGLGRPSLPIAVCDVEHCANAIAWCVHHFDEAPPVVNLFDPALATRRDLLAAMRRQGWTGRVCWVPISVLAIGVSAARTLLALLHGRLPTRLDVWSVLRPRRYDARLASALLNASRHESFLQGRVATAVPGDQPAGDAS
jgi:predicted dehydrogenase/nucleoside-diphosphate-sugar epimerase